MTNTFIRTASVLVLAAGLLSGCATDQTQPEGGTPHAQKRHSGAKIISGDASESDRDPLIDARYQTLVTCKAEEALGSGDKFAAARLFCPSLGVSATVTEFRDAGWRIESLTMSERKTPDGVIAIPFSVTLRKLF